MNKCLTIRRGTLIALAVAGLGTAGVTLAGPGCMNDPRMARWFYPYSPMAPPAAYAWQAAPAPYQGRMAAPYARPMTARQGNPAATGRPAAPSAAATGAEQTTRVAAGSDSTAAADAVTVRISGMRFEPANITVRPGTKVTWVQGDRMPHIISGKTGGMRSNTLFTGQEYSYIFQKPGSYGYACDLHPSMKGSVVVEEAGTGT